MDASFPFGLPGLLAFFAGLLSLRPASCRGWLSTRFASPRAWSPAGPEPGHPAHVHHVGLDNPTSGAPEFSSASPARVGAEPC